MAPRVKALINPDLLIWARQNLGYSIDDAATKIRVSSKALADWESGVTSPTLSQLRRLAQLYRRPIAIFYLSERPVTFKPLKEFRRAIAEAQVAESPQLKLAIEKAISRRQIALDLLEDLGERATVMDFTADLEADAEETATALRVYLSVTNEQQLRWKTEYEALSSWRSAIEKRGALVFQASGVKTAEMRGFSITQFPLPVVGLNSSDAPRGRIFSLLHEFIHIVIKQGGICDFGETDVPQNADERVEAQCNKLAGAVLLPKALLAAEPILSSRVKPGTWDDKDLYALSLKYKVSQEVVLRRLVILGLAKESFYRSKREEYLKTYQTLRNRKTKIIVPPHRKVVSNMGVPFAALVLNSYHRERITSSDVSDFLELNLKHLPKLQAELSLKVT